MADPTAIAAALAEARQRAVAQVAHLTAAIEAVIESSDEVLADDEHDPEGSTIAFERAQVAALLRDARANLEDVDRAHDRLVAGSYGRCARCGEPIAAERLSARPTAIDCVRCAAAAAPPSLFRP